MKHPLWGTGKKETRGHEKDFLGHIDWLAELQRPSLLAIISLPHCVISVALLTPGWGIEKTKEGVDLVLNFAGPALQTLGAGWLMILAREGLEQWIMESKWRSKGGKMREGMEGVREEREEPVPWDNCLSRLEWKEIGTESELLEFSAVEGSVWWSDRFQGGSLKLRMSELLRWMCWMDHTHRY